MSALPHPHAHVHRRSSFAYSVGGVPLEVMALLVNKLGADPWFCMPHTATDDYVRGFAQAALQLLRPDVKVGAGAEAGVVRSEPSSGSSGRRRLRAQRDALCPLCGIQSASLLPVCPSAAVSSICCFRTSRGQPTSPAA